MLAHAPSAPESAMDDRPFFLIFDLGGIAALAWWPYKLLAPTHHFVQHARWRVALIAALALSVAALLFVLRNWTSFDVVDAPFYIVGYLSLGVLWISASAKVLHGCADIRFQQDVRLRTRQVPIRPVHIEKSRKQRAQRRAS
jgi:hypothetical protein